MLFIQHAILSLCFLFFPLSERTFGTREYTLFLLISSLSHDNFFGPIYRESIEGVSLSFREYLMMHGCCLSNFEAEGSKYHYVDGAVLFYQKSCRFYNVTEG